MKDKVCIVTGGTDGIGKEAAAALAHRGARLLIHGRDPAKGERVVEELQVRSGNPAIEFLPADFGSLREVRELAAAILRRTTRIDVLINNAGAMFVKRGLSRDGFERTFAVNHLAPFLLTHLLLDALKASAPARIVTTASAAHRGVKLDFSDLQSERRYSSLAVYGRSKLANILFTRALAQHLEGTGVTATCMHPGFVRSSIGRDMDTVPRAIFNFISRFIRSPQLGAQTLVYLASVQEVQGESGGYYIDKRVVQPAAAAQDEEAAQRLWQVSEALVGLR